MPQITKMSNPSNLQFNISSIAAAGSFAKLRTAFTPGASCTVSVTFSPTTMGLQHALITITDSTQTSPQAVPLTEAASGVPDVEAGSDFAPQAVGTKSRGNRADAGQYGKCILTSIGITGANSSDSRPEQRVAVAPLASGGSCTVNLQHGPECRVSSQ